jgi:hypothetical protein
MNTLFTPSLISWKRIAFCLLLIVSVALFIKLALFISGFAFHSGLTWWGPDVSSHTETAMRMMPFPFEHGG